MVTNMNVMANLCVNLEAENSILRAQMAELTHRLRSLNDVVMFINSMQVFETFLVDEVGDLNNGFEEEYHYNPWRYPFANYNSNTQIIAHKDWSSECVCDVRVGKACVSHRFIYWSKSSAKLNQQNKRHYFLFDKIIYTLYLPIPIHIVISCTLSLSQSCKIICCMT